MEIITAPQETVAATRAEQVQNQDQFRTELDASRAANKELRRTWQCAAGDQYLPVHNRARTMPFSQEILDAVVPKNMTTHKITFIGAEDPSVHLAAFEAQTMILGGTYVAHCKLFVGTLLGTTPKWFIGLPNDLITTFD